MDRQMDGLATINTPSNPQNIVPHGRCPERWKSDIEETEKGEKKLDFQLQFLENLVLYSLLCVGAAAEAEWEGTMKKKKE